MDKFILNKKDQSYKKKIKLEKEERKIDEKDYKKKIKLEKEERKIDEKEHNPKLEKLKQTDMIDMIDMIVYKNQDIKKETRNINNDFFHIKEKGDNLLNNWIIKQKEPIIIFLSEFIPGTKVSKEIEQFRPIIKTTPTISIEEYRKKKKIGEEGVE
jgi:hypothetical protein